MSKLRKPIDYKQLELELQKAIKEDELYKLQNDAKIRAVEQNVPTYEHFRQMVNAAHLKPLDKADINQKIDAPWNTLITRSDQDSSEMLYNTEKKGPKREVESNVIASSTPTNYSDFSKNWSIISDDTLKFSYLYNCQTVLLQKIFPVEIPPALFLEVLSICLKLSSTTHRPKEILEVLTILSNSKRFNLTLSFMSSTERDMCEELFRTLLNKIELDDPEERSSIISLSARYKVPLN